MGFGSIFWWLASLRAPFYFSLSTSQQHVCARTTPDCWQVFKPVRKQEPMTSFLTIMASLAGFEVRRESLGMCGFVFDVSGIRFRIGMYGSPVHYSYVLSTTCVWKYERARPAF